jgi:hypothetical protein
MMSPSRVGRERCWLFESKHDATTINVAMFLHNAWTVMKAARGATSQTILVVKRTGFGELRGETWI